MRMRRKQNLLLVALLLQASACTPLPPKFVSSDHHPLFERDGNTNILADVCIKYDTVSDSDDRFLGADSRTIANDLLNNFSGYLSSNGIQVNNKQVPFVCGATHDSNNKPQPFSTDKNSPISLSAQPFDVTSELAKDPDYVNAQRIVSTYIFAKALNSANANSERVKRNYFSSLTPCTVSMDEFKAATKVIAAKSGQSNLLYIGVTGKLESEGKRFRDGLTLTAISAGISAGVAGATSNAYKNSSEKVITPQGNLYTAPRTVWYSEFHPIPGVYGIQYVTGLIDLRSGDLVWTNQIDGQRLYDPNSLFSLLSDITHKPQDKWSPPGRSAVPGKSE